MTTQAKTPTPDELRAWAECRKASASNTLDAWWQREAAMYAAVIAMLDDARRLDALEAMALDTERVGNGVAVFPYIVSATKEQRIGLQEMGDEDGSNCGCEITAGSTLREAIDEALATQEASNEQE